MKKHILGLLLVLVALVGGTQLVEAQEIVTGVNVDIICTSDKTNLNVGESGKLSIKPIYGVTPEGTFTPQKNAFFELNEDGTFKTLSVGETSITPAFTLSEESIKKIKLAYLKENHSEGANLDNIHILPQTIQAIPVTISNITENETAPITISYNFEASTTDLKVGQSGKLTVNKIHGVIPTGKFRPYKDEFIELKEDGTYTALKVGKTTFIPSFTISDESYLEMKKLYIQEHSDENLTLDDVNLAFPSVVQPLELNITAGKEQVSVPLNFTANPISLAVNESGVLSLEKVYGVTPKGTFKAEKNDFIELKEDGTYTALKVGQAKITPVFTLSSESIKEIKEAYIKEKNLTNVTVDDIDLVLQDIQPVITINVTEKTTTNNKPSTTNKNLPKTSEQSSTLISVFGTLCISLGFVGISLKRNEN